MAKSTLPVNCKEKKQRAMQWQDYLFATEISDLVMFKAGSDIPTDIKQVMSQPPLRRFANMVSYKMKHGLWRGHKMLLGLPNIIFGKPKHGLLQNSPFTG